MKVFIWGTENKQHWLPLELQLPLNNGSEINVLVIPTRSFATVAIGESNTNRDGFGVLIL